jgi:P-loop ATPase protein family
MTGTMTPTAPQDTVLAAAADQGPAEIISFGYGHGPAPAGAHVVLDVRSHYRDPHVDPGLRDLTAADEQVIRAVLDTPGVLALVGAIVATAHAYRAGPQPGPVRIAVGCAGGRHRSAVIAAEAAWQLELDNVPVTLTHRDIGRPVIGRPAALAPAAPATAVAADGSAVLSPADLQEVLSALDYAAEALSDLQSCEACARHDSGLCSDHADNLDQSDAYRAVAVRLGADGPAASGWSAA